MVTRMGRDRSSEAITTARITVLVGRTSEAISGRNVVAMQAAADKVVAVSHFNADVVTITEDEAAVAVVVDVAATKAWMTTSDRDTEVVGCNTSRLISPFLPNPCIRSSSRNDVVLTLYVEIRLLARTQTTEGGIRCGTKDGGRLLTEGIVNVTLTKRVVLGVLENIGTPGHA